MSCFMLGLKHTEVTASLWPRKERSRVGSSGCKGSTCAQGEQVMHTWCQSQACKKPNCEHGMQTGPAPVLQSPKLWPCLAQSHWGPAGLSVLAQVLNACELGKQLTVLKDGAPLRSCSWRQRLPLPWFAEPCSTRWLFWRAAKAAHWLHC